MKRAVLVTASSRGLGEEIARQFLKEGCTVIINGRNMDRLREILTDFGDVYRFHQDMTIEGSVENLRRFIDENGLLVDCAVNCLGGRLAGDGHPIDQDILEHTLRLNLKTAVEINSMLIPSMIKLGGGKIFHIGSSAGYTGNAAPCYAISKGALNTYIKNSARYYAKDSIMICGILPGILDHDGSDWDNKRKEDPEKYYSRMKAMPMGVFQKPTDIAPVIISIYKSGTMALTGSIIEAAGGM